MLVLFVASKLASAWKCLNKFNLWFYLLLLGIKSSKLIFLHSPCIGFAISLALHYLLIRFLTESSEQVRAGCGSEISNKFNLWFYLLLLGIKSKLFLLLLNRKFGISLALHYLLIR